MLTLQGGGQLTATRSEALAYFLEHDARVVSFVKNDHLDFAIPYVYEGVAHEFWPDFLVRLHPLALDDLYADGVTTGGSDL